MKSKLLIAGFLLLMVFPWIQALTKWLPDEVLAENRNKVAFPQWKTAAGVRGWLSDYQSWFNDHYPLRNCLIRTKNQIDFSLFRYSDRVYIGKDGFLFYRSVIDQERPWCDSVLTADKREGILDFFHRASAFMKRRGGSLVVMDNEMKCVVYPEKLPSHIPERMTMENQQALINMLRGQEDFLFTDATRILRNEKKKRPVFDKTDFHWNGPGSFVVARSMVNQIAERLGRPEAGWKIKQRTQTLDFSGGEAMEMPLLDYRAASERCWRVRQNWVDTPAEYTEHPKPGPFLRIWKNDTFDPAKLPGVVVIGDSFSEGLLYNGFREHFNNTYWVQRNEGAIEAALKQWPEKCKVLVIQFIETAAFQIDRSIPVPEN